MKLKNRLLTLLFIGIFSFPTALMAQTEPEEIAAVTDAFQDSFYESLKQKGIENYDKAIEALEKCRTLNPDNAEVYNELGKNYLFLKDYKKAYESFEQASQLDPKNKWFLVGMYDVCYQTQDDAQSIVLVKKLIEFDEGYKEDLTSLYMRTGQYDKALAMINELNDKVGKSEKRELYKADILKNPKYQDAEKANLLDQIKKNPKEESNYIALIFMYSESNQEEKALEIAKELEIEIPTSDWAQVGLFKFHLNNNDGEKAVASMNRILKSGKIDNKIKHRVINEFLIFTKANPQYDADLQKAIGYFDGDNEVKTAKEIGKFHQNKRDWDKAIEYYELDNKSNPNDMETILLLLHAYVEKGQFDKVASKADSMIESFPQQPDLYYYSGLAYNQLKNFKKAKDILEAGVDFLVDDRELEIDFYSQLAQAYNGLGDIRKKDAYTQKADKLLKQIK